MTAHERITMPSRRRVTVLEAARAWVRATGGVRAKWVGGWGWCDVMVKLSIIWLWNQTASLHFFRI